MACRVVRKGFASNRIRIKLAVVQRKPAFNMSVIVVQPKAANAKMFLFWPFVCFFLAVQEKSVASIDGPLTDAGQSGTFPHFSFDPMTPEQCARQFTAHCAPPNLTAANCTLNYVQIHCDNQANDEEIRQLAQSFSQSPQRAVFVSLTDRPSLNFDISPVRNNTVMLHLYNCVSPRTTYKLAGPGFANLWDFQLHNCQDIVVRKYDFSWTSELRSIQFVNTTMRSLEQDSFTDLPALRMLSLERGFSEMSQFSVQVADYLQQLHCAYEYQWFRKWWPGSQLLRRAKAGEIFRMPVLSWENEEIGKRDVYLPIDCAAFPNGSQAINFSQEPFSINEDRSSNASLSLTAVRDRPEIVMESADGAVTFLEVNATSKVDLVLKGNVSAGQHVNFRDLLGGTHYFIRARLLQNGRNVVRLFNEFTYPFPPVDISASENLTSTDSITLEWSIPFNTRIEGYQILYQRDDGGAVSPSPDLKIVNVSNAIATSFNVTGLEPGTTYSFRMRSFVGNVSSVETPAVLYCTRPLKPSFIVQTLPGKLILQLQRPTNSTKYYRVKLLNLDVKDAPVREIIIPSDPVVVNHSIGIDYEGATYEVRVAAVACDLLSEEVSQTVHSLPPPVTFYWPPTECSPTSISFAVSDDWKVHRHRGIFTRFVFTTDGIPPVYVLPNAVDRLVVELTGLSPGINHEILGWTERGEVQSEKRSMTVQLKPNNVAVIKVTNTTTNSIDFTWEPPAGMFDELSIDRFYYGRSVRHYGGIDSAANTDCFPVRST
ncbi:uncharacterized protein LOC129583710 [Paramacrobiotus metropolitanus]|uniref:uncharacterized protein LOC129583710 n=1 Tax=Paramacrobiotus metropolitanus TaxID=2943436 RepID=UPI002445EE95|nr:uncharacterized protein LOC129583710 [Paramacrobiotus metropolitanus]